MPLVATIHATEAGRHQGWLPAPLNRAIHSVESWLAGSAEEVITCSHASRHEAARLFDLDPCAVHVVPNGVDLARWRVPARSRAAARARYAAEGPLIAFAGRLVHEKGVQTLLAALPTLRRRHPGLRLAVAGTGPLADELHAEARRLRVARAVDWWGFVPAAQVATLLAAADVMVVPSSYEPFGLVALEAVAAGTPVVVSDAGGLADLHRDGVAAASFPAGQPAALADAVDGVLRDPDGSRRAMRRAVAVLRTSYTWQAVAQATAQIYRTAGARH